MLQAGVSRSLLRLIFPFSIFFSISASHLLVRCKVQVCETSTLEGEIRSSGNSFQSLASPYPQSAMLPSHVLLASLGCLSFLYISRNQAAVSSSGVPRESSGYASVRPGARLFWWLMRASNQTHDDHRDFPLLIFLEGGPGSSASGFSNLGKIGPLDADLRPRNHSWLSLANLLFIDSPVGSGFSTADREDDFAKSDQQVSQDLLQALKGILDQEPDLRGMQVTIAGTSYGAKAAVALALLVDSAIQSGDLPPTLKLSSVVLISPALDNLVSESFYARVLRSFSLVDQPQAEEIERMAANVSAACASGHLETASELDDELLYQISLMTSRGAIYNLLDLGDLLTGEEVEAGLRRKLHRTMNDAAIRSRLPVVPAEKHWKNRNFSVPEHLARDMMVPAVDLLQRLLNETRVPVFVMTGQLDMITNALGTEEMLHRIDWTGGEEFRSRKRTRFTAAQTGPAFFKRHDVLTLFWIMGAGHSLIIDQPATAYAVMRHILYP